MITRGNTWTFNVERIGEGQVLCDSLGSNIIDSLDDPVTTSDVIEIDYTFNITRGLIWTFVVTRS